MGFKQLLYDAGQWFTKPPIKKEDPQSNYVDSHESYRGKWVPIRSGNFNGEKTPGELGNVYNLTPSYRLLRLRAYEAELTNDVISTISGKFFKWVVGFGLKIQSEPNEKALKTEKITDIPDDFRENVESRFEIFANSTKCDYKGEENLHELALQAFKGAFNGDVLIILRVKEGWPTIQLVDGDHVKTPFLDDKNEWNKKAKEAGNIIRNGIEMDKSGTHVAYYVATLREGEILETYERIPAKGNKTNRKMAWLFGLKKHRMDNDRYIPMTTAILEKLAKLDRYTEATVGTAEERAKIPFTVEHSSDSTGENPFRATIAAGMGKNAAPETQGYELGEKTASNISATTGKQVFNMPRGAQLKALYSQNEIQYEAFWKAIFKSLCAAVEIPPEVALQEYNSNYSASRAAIGGWEFIANFYREKFIPKLYHPFYQLWLHTEILKGNIQAPGYLQNSTNFMVVEAYSKARFIGPKMPHIDPVKEVKAIVQMVNEGLMSNEMAAERLNSGDWFETQGKLKKESKVKTNNQKEEEPKKEKELKVVGNEN
ncbi:phage portal protein [Flagellimonas nanhaiensis]|nr:phage portal protein [Allomuricauda nanhaiensis]